MQALGATLSASSYSCWRSASSKNSGNALPERVSANWRMIPGIITLVATIIAVVCALLWECPYLCVAFAPGGLSSIYLIYMGWAFYHLKSLAKSNEELRSTATRLEGVNADLEKNVSDLKNVNKILERKVNVHVAQLELLTKGLAGLQTVTKGNIEDFEQLLAKFLKGVEAMESSLADTKKYLAENLKEQVDAIGTAAIEKLQETFAAVGDFLTQEEVKKYLAQRHDLNEEIASLQSSQERLLAKIAEYQGQVDLLKGLVEEVKREVINLKVHDSKLSDHDARLESIANTLNEASKRFSKGEKKREDN